MLTNIDYCPKAYKPQTQEQIASNVICKCSVYASNLNDE